MSSDLVRASAVTYRFGALTAVDDVDVAIGPGEVVGLLGANGAGKTTLVRLLLGLLAPTAGSVVLFGEAPSKQGQRRIGYVPQSLGLYDDLTPAENLAFIRAVFGTAPPLGGAPALRSLGELAEVPVGRLPLGLQRRLGFAAALEHRPELLLLDEPTSGVSPLASARLWEMIRSATEDGAGALVTTHDMEEAEQCDRLVVMASGRTVASGSVRDIIGERRAVVVTAPDWARARDALEAAGLSSSLVGRELRVPAATVEAVRHALAEVPARLSEAPVTLEERFVELVSGPAGR